jgi:serine/threonine protein kinase/Flp pilus assembly protein TadD
MLCPHCRAYNPNDARVCDRCAKSLVEPGTADDVTFIGGDSYAPAPPSGSGSGGAVKTPSPASASSVRSWASNTAALFSLQPGADFGPRYHIEAQIGEGGMGTVYKALDKELDRDVALKLIRPEMTSDEGVMQRFKQELLLASKITHKNVLRIHDLGEVQGVKFISMAFIEGPDLHHVLNAQGRLSIELAINISRQLLEALDSAHAAGVVHRDLKPQNILVDSAGQIYVSDFGLAKSLHAGAAAMTRSGEFLGTPRYMAPEQVEAKPVDRRTDLYAFGLILYEMVTGDVPFKADSTLALMYMRVKEKPKSPKTLNADIPDYLVRIIMRCLETDPALRYQSAKEILADLDAQRAPARSRSVQISVPMPESRRGRLVLAGSLVLVVVLALTIPSVRGWFFSRVKSGSGATVSSKAVTVLVADFTNHTGDPIFDGTLEPMVNIALEGASFINAYSRGDARKLAQKLPNPTDKLDEQSARLVALSQGVSVVIAGEISLRGNRYIISVIALDAATGNVAANAEVTAANKQDILSDIPKLAAPIRKALGDTTPASVQFDALTGAFKAASLEAVHQASIGMEQQLAGQFQDALRSFSKATELDPNFALAYSGMSAMASNLGRRQDADKYIRLAMEHEDRMTERERYRNRGLYYSNVGDNQKCVEELTQLVKRYPADRVGQTNLSVCLAQLRKIPEAVEVARRAVEIIPKGAAQRLNLSFFSSLGGDFETGEQEARAALQLNPSPVGYLSLAEAQLGQDRLSQAAETYHNLEKLGAFGSSTAALGLADLALYQGRFADAVRLLEQGAAADLGAKNPDGAADKFAALARVQLLREQKAAAVAAAGKALAHSQAVKFKFLAALVFVEAGELAKAQKLAASLGSELQAEPQAYGKIIEGKLALKRGDARRAIEALTDANKLLDTWIGHFELGQVYLAAGLFVDADSEFDRCVKRRGEALEFFQDNVPTYGFFPLVYYYQGRVREGLKSPGFAEPYRTYLSIKGQAGEDPLLPEIRRRIGK